MRSRNVDLIIGYLRCVRSRNVDLIIGYLRCVRSRNKNMRQRTQHRMTIIYCFLRSPCLSVCLSACLLSVCLSICMSVFLSVCLPVCQSICLSACCLSVILFVCMSTYLSVCLSVCLSLSLLPVTFRPLIIWKFRTASWNCPSSTGAAVWAVCCDGVVSRCSSLRCSACRCCVAAECWRSVCRWRPSSWFFQEFPALSMYPKRLR